MECVSDCVLLDSCHVARTFIFPFERRPSPRVQEPDRSKIPHKHLSWQRVRIKKEESTREVAAETTKQILITENGSFRIEERTNPTLRATFRSSNRSQRRNRQEREREMNTTEGIACAKREESKVGSKWRERQMAWVPIYLTSLPIGNNELQDGGRLL